MNGLERAIPSWVALDETNSIKEESAMSRQELRAEISGTIIEVSFSKGDRVEEGDTIIVMEAMKMEILAVAPCSGKIVEVRDQVRSGRFWPVAFRFSIRLISRSSTNGPFLEDLLTASPYRDDGRARSTCRMPCALPACACRAWAHPTG